MRTLVDRQAAEDITREVFVSLWEHPELIDSGRGTPARPASAGEVDAARDADVAAPREFGDLADGHVVVASGASQSGQWRIVADARRNDNIGSLSIERLWGAIASTSTTTGDRVEPPLDLGADVSDGTIVVWGLLWVDAASVTVEAPGKEPVMLDTYEV